MLEDQRGGAHGLDHASVIKPFHDLVSIARILWLLDSMLGAEHSLTDMVFASLQKDVHLLSQPFKESIL